MNQYATIANAPEPSPDLKNTILKISKYSGLFALSRFLTRKKTRVLAYHGIWLGDGHFGNFLYMSAEKFARRMALLEKWGYPIVPFEGLPKATSPHRCPTAITIDDGWYSTWLEMLPVLERHRYPATIYLTTYYSFNQAPVIDVVLSYSFSTIDLKKRLTLHLPEFELGPVQINSEQSRDAALATVRDICAAQANDEARQKLVRAVCEAIGINYETMIKGRWFHLMTPEEVQDAARRGINFELHTHRHRITYQDKDCLAEELAVNRERIKELTGTVGRQFCYPSGRFTPAAWPVLEQCQIESATTTDIGLVDHRSQRYAMPRILDGQYVSELEFEAEMSGFMELTRLLRGIAK